MSECLMFEFIEVNFGGHKKNKPFTFQWHISFLARPLLEIRHRCLYSDSDLLYHVGRPRSRALLPNRMAKSIRNRVDSWFDSIKIECSYYPNHILKW